jgi:hypothetical protein
MKFKIKTRHNVLRFKSDSAEETWYKLEKLRKTGYTIYKDEVLISVEDLKNEALGIDDQVSKIQEEFGIGIFSARSKPTTED